MSDWLFSEERLALRSKCLGILLRKFGWELGADSLPLHSMGSIQGCAHDWVSQGHPTAEGIVSYFESNYTKRG